MSGDQENFQQSAASEKWVFPGHSPRSSHSDESDESEESEESEPTVWLCTVPATVARAACARLESEGIACDIAQTATSDDSLSKEALLDILVAEADLSTAQEILARRGPMEKDAEEKEFDQEVAAINASNWVCPDCQQRALELLPLSDGWRSVRRGTVVALLAVVVFLGPMQEFGRSIGISEGFCIFMLFVTAMTLACSFIFPERVKKCTQCGWQSNRSAS